MVKKAKVQKKEDPTGVFIPAGLLIGIGIGFLVDQVPAGTLIGLGVGFLLMAIVKSMKK
jgi:hypothetical protein